MKHFYIFITFAVISSFSHSQSVATNSNLTLNELLESITTNLECTSISNIVSENNAQLHSQGFNSYGSFSFTNEPNFPFEQGIVLSTSDAADLTDGSSSGNNNWPGDTDIEALLQEPGLSLNATSIEFDFIPFRDELSVDYIMASREYPTFVCSFSDTFAFIVSGPGIPEVNDYDHDANPNTPDVSLDLGGLNIALIPGTNIPVGISNIHLNTSCIEGSLGEFSLPQFYDQVNSNNNITMYGGQTIPLTATVDLIPGEEYHIELVVADRADSFFDTAVFIDANSFVIGTIPEDLPFEPDLPVTLPECWSATESANFTISDQCTSDETNSLQMFGGNYTITTAAVNTDGISSVDISFDLLNGCSDIAEAGENLVIEFFDGSDWQLLEEIDPADIPAPLDENSNDWVTYNYNVNSGMNHNFMLRFTRFNGDTSADDISISNLKILNNTFSNTDFIPDANFEIYPNPAKDVVRINSNFNKTPTKLDFFSINGKLIKSISDLNSLTGDLDVSFLKQGMYVLKIYSGDAFTVKKLVKQ